MATKGMGARCGSHGSIEIFTPPGRLRSRVVHDRVVGTDSPELQIFREIARNAGIAFHPMFVKNSLRSRSIIGVYFAMKLGVKVVNFGVGFLAMHSIAETGAIKDNEALYCFCLEIANHDFEYE
jgi:aspartyl aminopeptidase